MAMCLALHASAKAFAPTNGAVASSCGRPPILSTPPRALVMCLAKLFEASFFAFTTMRT